MYTGELCEGKLRWCKVLKYAHTLATVWFQHGRLALFMRNVQYIYMVFEIVSFQVNSPCKLGFEDFSLWPSIFTVSRHVQAASTVWKEPTMISFTARLADVQGDHSNITMCYNNVAINYVVRSHWPIRIDVCKTSLWRHKLTWRH